VGLIDLALVTAGCGDDMHRAGSLRHGQKISEVVLDVKSISDYTLPPEDGQNHEDSGQK
jgi:hypothetical protein